MLCYDHLEPFLLLVAPHVQRSSVVVNLGPITTMLGAVQGPGYSGTYLTLLNCPCSRYWFQHQRLPATLLCCASRFSVHPPNSTTPTQSIPLSWRNYSPRRVCCVCLTSPQTFALVRLRYFPSPRIRINQPCYYLELIAVPCHYTPFSTPLALFYFSLTC